MLSVMPGKKSLALKHEPLSKHLLVKGYQYDFLVPTVRFFQLIYKIIILTNQNFPRMQHAYDSDHKMKRLFCERSKEVRTERFRRFLNTVLAINSARGERPRPSGAGNRRTASIVGDRVVQLVLSCAERVRQSSCVSVAALSWYRRSAAQCCPVRERVVYVDLVRPGGRCSYIRMDGDAEAPKTTTISTIAVQSGSTRIVIALLQVGISLLYLLTSRPRQLK